MNNLLNNVVNVLEDLGGGEIESVLNYEKLAIEEEAFMNERVVVYVHPSANDNDPTHFILNVNGRNQPVFRGNETPMRRMYLEVLARMKESKFSQRTYDQTNPEASNALQERTAVVYPFEVREDPNPKGRAWLRAIQMEDQR